MLLDGHLDMHFINKLESSLKETRFVRVDSDVIDKLIEKDEKRESKLTPAQQELLTPVFRSHLPEGDDYYLVSYEPMAEDQMPMKITQQEFMRRMKDMSSMSGMNFYGEMPDSYNLVVNSNHPLILDINTKLEETLGNDIQSIDNQIKPLKDEITKLNDQNKDKKEEDISTADKDKIEALEKEVSELEDSKRTNLMNTVKTKTR